MVCLQCKTCVIHTWALQWWASGYGALIRAIQCLLLPLPSTGNYLPRSTRSCFCLGLFCLFVGLSVCAITRTVMDEFLKILRLCDANKIQMIVIVGAIWNFSGCSAFSLRYTVWTKQYKKISHRQRGPFRGISLSFPCVALSRRGVTQLGTR